MAYLLQKVEYTVRMNIGRDLTSKSKRLKQKRQIDLSLVSIFYLFPNLLDYNMFFSGLW